MPTQQQSQVTTLWQYRKQSGRSVETFKIGPKQGRIYAANEYPAFARTMSMVGQKLTFLRQITSNVRQNLSVSMKNMQILG